MNPFVAMSRRSLSNRIKGLSPCFLLLLALVALPAASAEALTVVSQQDIGNVTVMEISGDFNMTLSDGSSNYLARADAAKEFYKVHKDEYDFLVFFTNFDTNMPAGVKGFYSSIRNDVQGLGLPPVDLTGIYGSQGRLQGTINMGDVSQMALEPTNPDFEETLYILAHEQMHRWGAYVRFKDASGAISSALLGLTGEHWSYLFDSDSSTLYGNHWVDNGDGTFTSVKPTTSLDNGRGQLFSPLELYLMGIYDKTQVPPMLLINNAAIDPTQLPELGDTITGEAVWVTIDDIIAAEGPRVPSAAEAQKTFRTAFIYLAQPGTVDMAHVLGVDALRQEWGTRFSILTDGAAMMESAPLLIDDGVVANPGVSDPVPPPTPARDLDLGVTWLTGAQQAGGNWQDLPETAQRDTAAALFALRNFPAAATSYQNGQGWLSAATAENVDYLARKTEALADPSAAIVELLGLQNADGGWGSDGGYRSNPGDTALALKALAGAGHPADAAVGNAVAYLKAVRNADGGWSAGTGPSLIQPTAHVLAAFNGYRNSVALETEIAGGIAWLTGKQNLDGGFGNSPSTVYDTAVAVSALRQAGASVSVTGPAADYLLNHQSADGSWYDSAFQTALAVEALYLAKNQADLIIEPQDIVITPANLETLPVTITVAANVSVVGSASWSLVPVALYDGEPGNGGTLLEEMLADLPGNASTPVSFSPITLSVDGLYSYYVVVDTAGAVNETSEWNNQAGKSVYAGPPPPTVGFDLAFSTGDESVGTVSLQVSLSKVWNKTITVDYRAGSDSTATPSADFLPLSGSLVFSPGETVKNIPLTILDDQLEEGAEEIVVELANPDFAYLGQARHVFTILANDTPPAAGFSYALSDDKGFESQSQAVLAVTLSASWPETVTVDYAVSPTSTATTIEDHQLFPGTLTFAPGETVKNIVINIIDDSLAETDELVTVDLTNAVNARLGSASQLSYTIWDNDSAPTVTIYSPQNLETMTQNNPPLSYAARAEQVVVYVDGQVVDKVAGQNLDPLVDGAHTVRVEAINSGIHKGAAEAAFTVDTSGTPYQAEWIERFDNGTAGETYIDEVKKVAFDRGAIYAASKVGINSDFYLAKHDYAKNRHWSVGLYDISSLTGGIKDLAVGPDGGIVVAGKNSANDMVVYKFNRYGYQLWKYVFGSNMDENPYQVAFDSNNNIYVIGETYGDLDGNINAGGSDIFIARFSPSGKKEWTRLIGTPADDSGSDVVVNSLGEVYLAGSTQGSFGTNVNAGLNDAVLFKLDQDGNSLWPQPVQFGTAENDRGSSIALDPQEDLYLFGITAGNLDGQTTPDGTDDMFSAKVSSAGVLQQVNQTNSSFSSIGGYEVDARNQVFVGGTSLAGDRLVVNKYDAALNFIWSYTYSGSPYEMGDTKGYAIDADAYGNVVVGGMAAYRTFLPDGVHFYIDPDGVLILLNNGINFAPPLISIDPVDPEPGVDSLLLSGVVEGGASVSVSVDTGAAPGVVTYNPTGPRIYWQCEITGLQNGENRITVTATDADGHAGSAELAYYADLAKVKEEPYEPVLGAGVVGYSTTSNGFAFDSLSNSYLADSYYDYNKSCFDAKITKIDSNGNSAGTWTIGTTDDEYGKSIAINQNGNIYVAMTRKYKSLKGNSTNFSDVYLAKYDGFAGTEIWGVTFGADSADDEVMDLFLDPTGNVYIAGYTLGALSRQTVYGGGRDYFVAKFDEFGTQLWKKQSGEPGDDYANGVKADAGGNVYITGKTETALKGSPAANSPFVMKFLPDGTESLPVIVGNQQAGAGYDLTVDESGNIYVTGEMLREVNRAEDFFLAKYDPAGVEQWLRHLGMHGKDYGRGVAMDSQGNLLVAGSTSSKVTFGSVSAGRWDAFYAKYDRDGERRWVKQVGSGADDRALDALIDANGDLIIGGVPFGVMKIVDQAPPGFTIDAVISPTNLMTQTVGGTLEKGASVQVAVDTLATVGPVDDYSIPYRWSCEISNLAAGPNQITVTATDAAGNSAVKTATISLDLTAPAAPLVTGATPTNDTTPAWSWTAGDATGSGTYRYSLDADGPTYTVITATSFTPAAPLAEGSHTLYVQERDAAGNWSPSGAFTLDVDTVAPAAPQVSGPAATNDTTPTWSWTAGDATGSGTFRYSLDADGPAYTETAASTFTQATPLAQGFHTLYVQERDAAGNWSASGSFSITIDTTPPAAPVVTGITPINDTTPTWSWSAGDATGNGTFRYSLDADGPTYTETTALTFTPATVLSEGSHTLYVQERDDAGNWSASGSFTLTVDTMPPAATVDPTPSLTNMTSLTLTGTMEAGAEISVFHTNAAQFAAMTYPTSTTWEATLSGLVEGTNTFQVLATDAAANTTTLPDLSITVDTIAPAVAVDPVASPTRADSQTITGTREADAAISLTVDTAATAGAVSYPTATTWTCTVSALAEGVNTLTATATDAAGNSASAAAVIEYSPHLLLSGAPASISADYQGAVPLTITNLAGPGRPVQVEQVVDVNGNGAADAGEPVVRRFTVTDGAAAANPNVQGDEDGAADGRITTTVDYLYLLDLYHAPGDYLFRAVDQAETDLAALRVDPVSRLQTIEGRVTDGVNPVPGAFVQLVDKWQRPVAWATTDSVGHYLFNVAGAGEYHVIPMAYGYGTAKASIPLVNLTAGAALTVPDLALAAGAWTVSGQVYDQTSSAGIGGVLVQAEGADHLGLALTNALGNYALTLPAGDYRLGVPMAAFAGPAQKGYRLAGNEALTVSVAGDLTGNDFTLTAGEVLVGGRVTDEFGLPMAGLPVAARLTAGGEALAYGVTDVEGYYTLALAPGESWIIVPEFDAEQSLGYIGSAIEGFSTTTGSLSGNDLAVQATSAWISGSVVDGVGSVVGGISVYVRNGDWTLYAATTTATDGTFRLAVPAGSWSAAAGALQPGAPATNEQSATVAMGETAVLTLSPGAAIAPQTLTVPSNSYDGTITLSWSASSTPNPEYLVQGASQPDFSDAFDCYLGPLTTASLSGQSDGTYYYRVKTRATGYPDSSWTEGANPCVFVYTPAPAPAVLNVPTLVGERKITLTWEEVNLPGAQYLIQQATQPDFSDAVGAWQGTGSTKDFWGRPDGTYYFRIRTIVAGYPSSPWMEGSNACQKITAGKVFYPNGGEVLSGGDVVSIQWEAGPESHIYHLRYSIDGGQNWIYITNVTDQTSFSWTLPRVLSDYNQCLVKVSAHDGNNIWINEDVSDSVFTIQVGALPAQVVSPNGGEVLSGGSTYTVQWSAATNAQHYHLRYSLDNGATWTYVAEVTSATSYQWKAPYVLADQSACLFKVTAHDTTDTLLNEDVSDAPFTIQVGALPVQVMSPNGGEVLSGGSSYTISWNPATWGHYYYLRYSTDNGATWNYIAKVTGVTTYDWFVPTPAANQTQCLVKVTAHDASDQYDSFDVSDAFFTIRRVPRVISPNGGEIIDGGTMVTLRWSDADGGYIYYLHYSKDNGATWTLIKRFDTPTTVYDWKVPVVQSDWPNCLIKVTAHDTSDVYVSYDISDDTFTIKQNPYAVDLTSPDGGETLVSGTIVPVNWSPAEGGVYYYLRYSTDNGSTWNFIVKLQSATTFDWLVPDVVDPNPDCLFKVTAHDVNDAYLSFDESNSNFTISPN